MLFFCYRRKGKNLYFKCFGFIMAPIKSSHFKPYLHKAITSCDHLLQKNLFNVYGYQIFADSTQSYSSYCTLALLCLCLSPCVCLFLLLPGRRRGTVICGRGDHQSPAGTLQPEPSCSPLPSCCSGKAESSGCS